MESWKKTTWILWSGVLMCGASYTMVTSFLPLYLLDLGVEADHVKLWAGIVYASAFFISAIMAPFWGALADKYGKRNMMMRAGIGLALVYALMAVAQNQWQLVAIRLLHGFVGGFVPASMAIAVSVAPPKQLGWSIGLMQSGSLIGAVIGPLLGGGLSVLFGIRASFIVSACLIFSASLIVVMAVREEKQEKAQQNPQHIWGDFKNLLGNRILLFPLGLMFVLQFSLNMIQPLLTLHILSLQGDRGSAVLTSGLILSLVGVAGMIASPFWGRVGEQVGYYRILAWGLLAAGGLAFSQYFVFQLWVFAMIQFFFGLFVAGISLAAATLVVRSSSSSVRGRVFGLTTSANHFGAMIGPLVGGFLGVFMSIHWIFIIAGLLLILSGAVVPSAMKFTKSQM